MTKPVRVRIAPSPTGNLHVGTARAALFNELFARNQKGSFIIRIEDTDPVRSKPEFEQNILEGLSWLGLTWDEGPDKGGAHGPYRQSERKQLYTQALQNLLAENKAYYCTCPPATKEHPRVQPCACSTAADASSRTEGVIRLRVTPQEIEFADIVRGQVKTHTDSFGGDFVIAKSLQDPLFHLAVVVDDAAMEITHVIRGEDHISNTARHILLQQALGYSQPVYAHLPLLLDESRRKLSKRSGETSLTVYRDMGYLPEAMLNYLALLGWSPKNDEEFFSHEELIEQFSLANVQKGGAIFSLEKLGAINKHYIRSLTAEELLERATPFFKKADIDTTNETLLLAAIKTEQERITTLQELPDAISFFLPSWKPEYAPGLLIWRKSNKDTTVAILQQLTTMLGNIPDNAFTLEKLETQLLAWIDENKLGRGDTLWPMRVALTGREHSPGPFEVASVLGKKETLQRLEQASLNLIQ